MSRGVLIEGLFMYRIYNSGTLQSVSSVYVLVRSVSEVVTCRGLIRFKISVNLFTRLMYISYVILHQYKYSCHMYMSCDVM